MFCFSRANHAGMNLQKVLSCKTRQIYLIYPFPRRLKLEKSLETCCVNFFFAWADILTDFKREKSVFWKASFCKTKTDYAYKLRAQDFETGKSFSFNQFSKQEFFFFSRESNFIRAIDFVSGLHNCFEFSQPLSCLYQDMQTQEKRFLLLKLQYSTLLEQKINFKVGNMYTFTLIYILIPTCIQPQGLNISDFFTPNIGRLGLASGKSERVFILLCSACKFSNLFVIV